jgi:Luciferase-like monooxygenase
MREIGVFLPIARNGYLISSASPQYSPAYDLNRDVAIAAERYGFDFALAMIKLRGYGGVTRHWDECLEAFTLTAALAAVTKRIRFFPSVAVLTMPPPFAARMVATSTRWRRDDAASTLFQVGKRRNTSRWEFGRARTTFGGATNIARSIRRFCRSFGRPGKATSKGNSFKWTTAALDHCRPEKWRCLRRPERFGDEICRQIWRLQLYQRELH